MSYRLEVAGSHVLGLDDPMHEGEIVQEYSDVYEYGVAVLDPDTGDLRVDLTERFECINGDLMFLHLLKVLPAHRGRDVGLVVASRLIESYVSGLVVCRHSHCNILATIRSNLPPPEWSTSDSPRAGTRPGETPEVLVALGIRAYQRRWHLCTGNRERAAVREGTHRAEAVVAPSQLMGATEETAKTVTGCASEIGAPRPWLGSTP